MRPASPGLDGPEQASDQRLKIPVAVSGPGPQKAGLSHNAVPQRGIMARQTHLKRRAGRYYWRLRIPADLLAIAGRAEIARTLGCSEHATARQLALSLSARAASIFQATRLYGYGRERLWGELDTLCAAPAPQAPLPPPPPPLLPAPYVPAPLPRPVDPRHQLSAVIAGYCDETSPMWTAKTKLMNEASLRLFLEHQGDKEIGEIGRGDLREFKELLRKLPPNYTKRFKGKSLTDVSKLGVTPISAKTVNKNLSVVSSLFTWAKRNGYCTDNPAKGLAVPIKTRPHEERDAFTEADLKVLFGSPLYTGCHSLQRRSTPGTLIIRDEKWWFPLIALYSGMRLEEIAQMKGTDILQIDDIWCFSVHGREGNSLKTPAAARHVPVHSELLALGLIDFAAAHPKALWNNLRKGSDGTLSSAFSKWFSRYISGLKDPENSITFHSLRHTFANYLKQHNIAEPIARALLGHTEHSVAFGRYGKQYSTSVLKIAVETAPSLPILLESPLHHIEHYH